MSTTEKKEPYNKGQGRGLAWLREHASYQSDDCLIWPMARNENGYGNVGVNGKVYKTHRFMCELVNGPALEGHEVAHLCGGGHTGCVNPRHLSWKTKSQNQRDRRTHGTQAIGRRFKLTPDDVAEIRRLLGCMTQAKIAARFGTTVANIQRIKTGKTWKTGEYEFGGFSHTTGQRE